jgi:DNA ligase-1
MQTYDTLYKRDSAGRTRVWWMERRLWEHRTCSGLLDGTIVTSGWTVCVPKSQPDAERQAQFEVAATYEHNLSRDYHASVDTIDTPKFFVPMLAKKFNGWSDTTSAFAQPKLDGVRCITTIDGMFSREGKPITGAPHIRASLQPFFDEHPEAILDGELYNHAFKDNFNAIISAVRKLKSTPEQLEISASIIEYWVYDYPSKADRGFGVRIALLANDLPADLPACIIPVPTFEVTSAAGLDDLYGQWLEAGFEGQMVRAPKGPYDQNRSSSLLKRKEFQDAEFECVAIEPGLGNWAGMAKRVTCRLPDGRLFGAGIKGTQERAKELLTETHKVVTIRFFNYTPDGVPRFGVATVFHGEERTL